MIVLSTAVAADRSLVFGNCLGVMETFSGVARSNAASLTAMAPGVPVLSCDCVGLLVAIPAMSPTIMVTSIEPLRRNSTTRQRIRDANRTQYVDTGRWLMKSPTLESHGETKGIRAEASTGGSPL